MRENISPTDVYMQWFNLPLDVNATTKLSGTSPQIAALYGVTANTGLSIRGEYFWLIHRVEFYWYITNLEGVADARGSLVAALSSRSGLTVLPAVEDAGVVAYDRRYIRMEAAPAVPWHIDLVGQREFSPPLPYAAPKMTLYIQGVGGNWGTEEWTSGRKLNARIGFTTAPLTAKMYDEIAEVWAYDTY